MGQNSPLVLLLRLWDQPTSGISPKDPFSWDVSVKTGQSNKGAFYHPRAGLHAEDKDWQSGLHTGIPTCSSPALSAIHCCSKATLRQGLKLHYGTCPEAKKTLQHPLSSSDIGKDLLTLQLALEVKMMLAEIFPW